MTSAAIQHEENIDLVICLHSSMSSSRQWDGLAERLGPSCRVEAVDLHGYGRGPQWEYGPVSLQQEVSPLLKLIDAQQGSVHLVGHSYGAAVAIKTAQLASQQVSSLTIYEPPVFCALFSNNMVNLPEVRAAGQLIADMHRSYLCGNADLAASRFVDYWSGAGAWNAIAADKQLELAQQIPTVLANFEALLSETDLFTGLADAQIPTLCLAGEQSPAVVAPMLQALQQQLPHAQTHRFPGLGHLGPITHTDVVNNRIAGFVLDQGGDGSDANYPRAA